MRFFCSAASVLVLVLAGMHAVGAQSAPHPEPEPQAADYRFASGSGMLFFYVRPDRTAEFEQVVARMRDILDTTDDPVRREQAVTWRMFRSVETAREEAIYVFVFDPVVAGTDYDPVTLLGEAVAADVHILYEQLSQSVVRVERMGLDRLR